MTDQHQNQNIENLPSGMVEENSCEKVSNCLLYVSDTVTNSTCNIVCETHLLYYIGHVHFSHNRHDFHAPMDIESGQGREIML